MRPRRRTGGARLGLLPSVFSSSGDGSARTAVHSGIVGYEALGRHGVLGVVVAVDEQGPSSPSLVVRGGVSDALVYHVSWAYVRRVSTKGRRVELDVDLADFVPALREDGVVELRLSAGRPG